MNRSRLNRTELDQIGPKGKNGAEVDRMNGSRPNRIKVDDVTCLGPKGTE